VLPFQRGWISVETNSKEITAVLKVAISK